jgi:hypothetical protein
MVIGVVGAFIGDWLMPRLGLHLGVGVILLLIVRLVRGGGRWSSGSGLGWGRRGGGRW